MLGLWTKVENSKSSMPSMPGKKGKYIAGGNVRKTANDFEGNLALYSLHLTPGQVKLYICAVFPERTIDTGRSVSQATDK